MYNALKKYIRHPFPFQLSHSALLVIDMQRFFLDKKSHAYLGLARPIIPRIKKLIAFYRANRLPIIFTRHAIRSKSEVGLMGRWWRDTLFEHHPHARIIEELKPLKNELVIRKTRYSAFAGTSLAKALRKYRVKRLVITGVLTHLCCETTARDAFVRDFEVFFVTDGTATVNRDLHLSSLKTLSDGFAIPVTTQQILNTD